MIRRRVQKKMPRAVPLSRLSAQAREGGAVVCYEGRFSDMRVKRWSDFIAETARLRSCIKARAESEWLLHCDDLWFFLIGYTALLQCGKTILLTANTTPSYRDEIRGADTALLCDTHFDCPHYLIQSLLAENPAREDPDDMREIDADNTRVCMFTSGSTGTPKRVEQRLTEFENDNAFILSQWGGELIRRPFCSTVNQHHIYGLLYAVMLPFTAGIPFRRARIAHPEELRALTDSSYTLITVPAFLKRAVEGEGGALLEKPFIISSGGVLEPALAAQTEKTLGGWPLEVYGSTETSGIAWRVSRQTLEWTPFAHTHIHIAGEGPAAGCLVARSPYIKNPEGFTTGDTAELLPQGTFLLKGRADTIVKIEEKRVSLAEVEQRILQSGLAQDAAVVALEGKRQYLAAAIVLNEAGGERFANMPKLEINRYWTSYLARFFEAVVLPKRYRYVAAIPADTQGKKRKDEAAALFTQHTTVDALNETCLEHTDTTALLAFTPAAELDYFNGHFPDFKLLPAVAQVDIALRLGAKYFKSSILVDTIKRVKFSGIIRPNTRIHLALTLNTTTNTLNFVCMNQAGNKVYSSGALGLKDVSCP